MNHEESKFTEKQKDLHIIKQKMICRHGISNILNTVKYPQMLPVCFNCLQTLAQPVGLSGIICIPYASCRPDARGYNFAHTGPAQVVHQHTVVG